MSIGCTSHVTFVWWNAAYWIRNHSVLFVLKEFKSTNNLHTRVEKNIKLKTSNKTMDNSCFVWPSNGSVARNQSSYSQTQSITALYILLMNDKFSIRSIWNKEPSYWNKEAHTNARFLSYGRSMYFLRVRDANEN
jgi:hypothetical protein